MPKRKVRKPPKPVRVPLADRVRGLLLRFPCPTCRSRLVVTASLRLPIHGACSASGLPLGLFDDGLAAIPLAHQAERVSVEAIARLGALMADVTGGEPQHRCSTSVVGDRKGRAADVSGGLPTLGHR